MTRPWRLGVFAIFSCALTLRATCPDFTVAAPMAGAGYPNGVGIRDFNRDGRPDLAVLSDNSVAVYLQNSNGSFAPAVVYGLPSSCPQSLAIADLNRDGNPDLAV